MSIFHTAEASCAACGSRAEVELVASVNADRRPDLREAILDRSFQGIPCPACDLPMRLAPHLTYLDIGRGQWILAEPAALMSGWAAQEEEARSLFEASFGAAAPPGARALGADIQPRLVYGWPALREKLVCVAAGLDDTTLELLKLAVLRRVEGSPIEPLVSLRLVAAEPETLLLEWTNDDSEAVLARLEVPRSLHADIAGDVTGWAALRGQLAGGVFVDANRLLLG